MELAELKSVELNYKKLGEGPDLIILHGLFGSLDNWMSLAKKWADDYTVWLIDQRNHGKSPHTDEFSYQLMAADLETFMDQHEIGNAIILGHSMGGKTAMEFSMHAGRRIEKLIVVDIAPVNYEVHHYGILEALNAVKPGELESRSDADDTLKKFIDEFGIRQFLLKNLDRNSDGGYRWKFNLPIMEKEIVPISSWDISDGSYEGECLFVKGENSNYILPDHAMRIQEKFPKYQLTEVAGAGHWVHAEKAEEFFQLVTEFMKD